MTIKITKDDKVQVYDETLHKFVKSNAANVVIAVKGCDPMEVYFMKKAGTMPTKAEVLSPIIVQKHIDDNHAAMRAARKAKNKKKGGKHGRKA